MKQWCLAMWLLLPALAVAEPVVVIAGNSPIQSLTGDEVRQLFTGQARQVAGHSLTPLDLGGGNPLHERFYSVLMGKSASQMRSYWARMIFTGRGMPPRQLSGVREMQLLVGSNRRYIGYLDAEQVTARLKVVFRP
ncbi:MAG: hypothetical protein R3292_11695 [Alcanivorax sp.]|nr:hypothetical protein [Alcanivorax sp.]